MNHAFEMCRQKGVVVGLGAFGTTVDRGDDGLERRDAGHAACLRAGALRPGVRRGERRLSRSGTSAGPRTETHSISCGWSAKERWSRSQSNRSGSRSPTPRRRTRASRNQIARRRSSSNIRDSARTAGAQAGVRTARGGCSPRASSGRAQKGVVVTESDTWHPVLLTVYGLDTCDDTTRARKHFDDAGLSYRYVNLDRDAATKARLHGASWRSTPVVVTPAGLIAMEPDNAQLDELAAIVRHLRGQAVPRRP